MSVGVHKSVGVDVMEPVGVDVKDSVGVDIDHPVGAKLHSTVGAHVDPLVGLLEIPADAVSEGGGDGRVDGSLKGTERLDVNVRCDSVDHVELKSRAELLQVVDTLDISLPGWVHGNGNVGVRLEEDIVKVVDRDGHGEGVNGGHCEVDTEAEDIRKG